MIQKMDENVTNIEETADEKVNTDTTMNEKAVEAEHMEAEQADPEVEQQDEEAGDSAASYLPLAADQLDLAKQYKQMMLIYEAGIRQLTTDVYKRQGLITEKTNATEDD